MQAKLVQIQALVRLSNPSPFGLEFLPILTSSEFRPRRMHEAADRPSGDLVTRTKIFRAFAHAHARKRMQLPATRWGRRRDLYKLASVSCFQLIQCNTELANHLLFVHTIHRSFLIISSSVDSHDHGGVIQELILGWIGSSPSRRSRAHRQRRPSLRRVLRKDLP
jgi:hypothetical protein